MNSSKKGLLPTQKFSEHPATVGETYGEHCRFAFGIATQLAAAAGAAAIHAVYPPAFETTASERIKALNDIVTGGARGASESASAEVLASELAVSQ